MTEPVTMSDTLAFLRTLERKPVYPDYLISLHLEARQTALHAPMLAMAKGRYLGGVVAEVYPIEEEQ